MRRGGGGGAITFKNSMNKKNLSSAGLKQLSPPLPGKGLTSIEKQSINGNLSLNIAANPL